MGVHRSSQRVRTSCACLTSCRFAGSSIAPLAGRDPPRLLPARLSLLAVYGRECGSENAGYGEIRMVGRWWNDTPRGGVPVGHSGKLRISLVRKDFCGRSTREQAEAPTGLLEECAGQVRESTHSLLHAAPPLDLRDHPSPPITGWNASCSGRASSARTQLLSGRFPAMVCRIRPPIPPSAGTAFRRRGPSSCRRFSAQREVGHTPSGRVAAASDRALEQCGLAIRRVWHPSARDRSQRTARAR